MKKMFLLFSHTLSESQKVQAKEELSVKEFIPLPSNLQKLWSQIDPDLDTLKGLIEPIEVFLKEKVDSGDYALIQGDFGAVYMMVNFTKKLGVIPMYATTKRYASEFVNADGNTIKKSKFEHRRFRKYGD